MIVFGKCQRCIDRRILYINTHPTPSFLGISFVASSKVYIERVISIANGLSKHYLASCVTIQTNNSHLNLLSKVNKNYLYRRIYHNTITNLTFSYQFNTMKIILFSFTNFSPIVFKKFIIIIFYRCKQNSLTNQL